MLFDRSDKGAKSLDSRWHEKARRAKRTTSSLDQWSEREIERWDLDDEVRKPTGRKHPETWHYDKPLQEVNRNPEADRRVDARDLPTIGDADEDQR